MAKFSQRAVQSPHRCFYEAVAQHHLTDVKFCAKFGVERLGGSRLGGLGFRVWGLGVKEFRSGFRGLRAQGFGGLTVHNLGLMFYPKAQKYL